MVPEQSCLLGGGGEGYSCKLLKVRGEKYRREMGKDKGAVIHHSYLAEN